MSYTSETGQSAAPRARARLRGVAAGPLEAKLAGVEVISCDVFDTLLLRNSVSESGRVRLIAERASRMLTSERNLLVPPVALARARAEVQRTAYRALDMLDPNGEAPFSRMLEAWAASVGLGAAETELLARAELAVERSQLKPNRPLLDWLKERARAGVRVIAISDTWHSASTVRDLLDSVAPGHPVSTVYTSADLNLTKRSSLAFPDVAAKEGVPVGRMLHLGDDALADDQMARRAGVRVLHLPRAKSALLARRFDGLTRRLRSPAPR